MSIEYLVSVRPTSIDEVPPSYLKGLSIALVPFFVPCVQLRQTQAARTCFVTQAMKDFLELRLRGANGTVKVPAWSL